MTHEAQAIRAIRVLSAAAITRAGSGHPGTPLGAAPSAYALYGMAMKHHPADPAWPDRDRFVLSAGHASMLLYASLHLFGYPLSIEDLKALRTTGSKTPGHPEYGHTIGVETTTGPLGQGLATAVGMAVAEKHLAARFNKPGFPVVDHATYVIAGDGCMMEGVSGEASSLAGTLGLGKLIVIYDSNGISIEGGTDLAFAEDTAKRYEAYGWQVLKVADGENVAAIAKALADARADARPSLIVVSSVIGFGTSRAGKPSAHGDPLTQEILDGALATLAWEGDAFAVPDEVYAHCQAAGRRGAKLQAEWEAMMARYAQAFPEDAAAYNALMAGQTPDVLNDADFWAFDKADATRNTSGKMLERLAARLPGLIGGSADLGPSCKTYIKGSGDFSAQTPEGANMHFGVREFAMGCIANGMALHGGLHPYVGTFFVFCDYMKPAMRLAALMGLPVMYVLTHDSIGVGEDGPTHQPIEHLAMLRALPGMLTFRPADGKETAAGYAVALKRMAAPAHSAERGPISLVLSRQNLPCYENSGPAAMRGGYVISPQKGATPGAILMASGSEVAQCVAAQALLTQKGIDASVVSMPCMELFLAQDAAYQESVLPSAVRARVAVEAASAHEWHRFTGLDGIVIGMKGYGASASPDYLFALNGFTAENIAEQAASLL